MNATAPTIAGAAAVAFELAGLSVVVRSPFAGALGGLGATYGGFAIPEPPSPDLVVELEHVGHLPRRPSASDPSFRRRREGETLIVERDDVEGRIEVRETPVVARFKVPAEPAALEVCVRVALSVALPRRGALLFHASAVSWSAEARMFAGVSGAGKSTIAALLATAHPSCTRLADELVVVARGPGGWSLHVPPFVGKVELPLGARMPLARIHLLAQAPHARRTPLAPGPALRELLRHVVVYAADPVTTEHVLALAAQLVAEIPCERLEFAKDPAVGAVLGVT